MPACDASPRLRLASPTIMQQRIVSKTLKRNLGYPDQAEAWTQDTCPITGLSRIRQHMSAIRSSFAEAWQGGPQRQMTDAGGTKGPNVRPPLEIVSYVA